MYTTNLYFNLFYPPPPPPVKKGYRRIEPNFAKKFQRNFKSPHKIKA